jgi:hypothetical protein
MPWSLFFSFINLNLCVTVAQCDRTSTSTKEQKDNIHNFVYHYHVTQHKHMLDRHSKHFGDILKSAVSTCDLHCTPNHHFLGICWVSSAFVVAQYTESKGSPLLMIHLPMAWMSDLDLGSCLPSAPHKQQIMLRDWKVTRSKEYFSPVHQ